MGSGGLEAFEHQVNHGDMHPGFAALRAFLNSLCSTVGIGTSRLKYVPPPPSAQHLEVVDVRFAFDYGEQPSPSGPSPRHQSASSKPMVSTIRLWRTVCVPLPVCQRRNPWAPFFRGLHRLTVDDGRAGRGIPPSSLPNPGAQASSMRSQVPSSRQLRKYHHTVPQGGKSWGIPPQADQGMPPRSTYPPQADR